MDTYSNQYHYIIYSDIYSFEEFILTIKFILSSTYFTFNNIIYKQIFGTLLYVLFISLVETGVIVIILLVGIGVIVVILSVVHSNHFANTRRRDSRVPSCTADTNSLPSLVMSALESALEERDSKSIDAQNITFSVIFLLLFCFCF